MVLGVGADALAIWEMLPEMSLIQGAPAVEPDQGSSH
jgi:hypothetical protein